MKREPTTRQRAFLKHFTEAGFDNRKGKECAIKAGYTPTNAAARASELKRSPLIKTPMQKALIAKGLDFDAMAKETARLALRSMSPFNPNMPDNEARRRTIEMAGKFHDAFPSQKIDIRKTEARYNMTEQDVQKLRAYKAEQALEQGVIDAEIIEEEGIESF